MPTVAQTVTQTVTQTVIRPAARIAVRLLLTLLAAVLILAGMNPAAAIAAERSASPSESSSSSSSSSSPSSSSSSSQSSQSSSSQSKGVALLIESETSTVITNTSGYKAKVTIRNNTDASLDAGTLEILTSPRFSFDSSLLMQEWADNTEGVDPRLQHLSTVLGSAKVGSIDPGKSMTIAIVVPAGKDVLSRFTTWGPKPLDFVYASPSADTVHMHSFVTRTQDGLNIEATPKLGVVAALPLTSSQWKVGDTAVKRLLTQKPSTASESKLGITTLSSEAKTEQNTLSEVLERHTGIQTISDPDYLSSFGEQPRTTAIMQPDGFDIAAASSTYGGIDWKSAGITTDSWNAATSLEQYRSATQSDTSQSGTAQSNPTPQTKQADPATIAWQSKSSWSLKALTLAKQQGYSTVVAESDYEPDTPSAVHTSKMVVHTSAGAVTVLNTQRELSTLAQDTATSHTASAENTFTGRLSRFIAQSAFYQMEAPYEDRELLISLGSNPDADRLDTLMSALESCSWLKIDSLSSLMKATPYIGTEEANERAAKVAQPSGDAAQSIEESLRALKSSRDTITRFQNNVLAETSGASQPKPSASATTLIGNGDAQPSVSLTARQWMTQILEAHDEMAMKAFSSSSVQNTIMTRGARQMAYQLYSGVSLAQPDSISIVSQSAKMPITIANDHPYAVRVRFASASDSALFSTTQDGEVVVPPNSEVQDTITVHVLQSGTANIHITLQDHEGNSFGAGADARVTSVLQINDRSGYVILALAAVLGVVGLWRQFNRVKDPDE
ncbi:DUF6049 family protein [Bifidobacterium simiarum]|uniref:DUF6049 family protein n=1 Tax=Bifidobacterium simiarum TaxID=2045441 RepID=UPI0013FDA4D3|nr:DUF6049 family protein [Bifidobacterium simiarum]